MLKVEELFKLVALKALIRGVKEHVLLRKLYALLDRILLDIKQVMENYIWVEETNLLWNRPSYFYKDNQHERPSKQNHYPHRNRRSRKNHEGSTRGHLVYPKDL